MDRQIDRQMLRLDGCLGITRYSISTISIGRLVGLVRLEIEPCEEPTQRGEPLALGEAQRLSTRGLPVCRPVGALRQQQRQLPAALGSGLRLALSHVAVELDRQNAAPFSATPAVGGCALELAWSGLGLGLGLGVAVGYCALELTCGATVALRTARPRLVRVRRTYRGAPAALRLRYVRYAGGWYA
jgi:hypothetical protein